MAGVTWDEKTQTWTAAPGVDVGFLAATQPDLLDRGIDTAQEIVDWYGTEGQRVGAPANRNEQLAREAGFQGTFAGGETWDTQVQDFYDKGFATSGAAAGPNMVYENGSWREDGKADPYSYGAAPNSDVWFGAGSLDNGYIYKAIGQDKPVVTDDAGKTVLGGKEIYWDPDVRGGAASAGIMDHRMVTQTATVRGPAGNFAADERASWQTFKDAPYNNFALVDEFVNERMLKGDWNNYSATELKALEGGAAFSMGTKQTENEQAQEFIGGHTFNADQYAEHVAPVLNLHGAAVNPKTVDPGFFTGGSPHSSRIPNPSEWWANPALDQYLKPGSSWMNLAFRDRVNSRFGRSSSSVVLPSDVAEYQNQLNPNPRPDPPWFTSMGGNGTPPPFSEPDRGGGGTSVDGGGDGRDDLEENMSQSIFTNSVTGYDDDFLFRAR